MLRQGMKKTTKKKTVTAASLSGKDIPKGKVSVGKAVPSLSAAATGGKDISLDDFKGKTVVLYFYPKDATPGCTIEGHDFTKLHKQFKKAGAEVLGISRDSVKSHEKFKEKQNYSFDLLSDEDEKVCGAFGVIKMKNMYGKQVRGIERSTFVIDKAGKLVKEWRGVKVPGHAEEVLEYVKSL
jgi:thioredoxin-dependent peroxiredoxin